MQGNTGRLFRELSVALAGAVALSAFVALTLTPMLSSKLVRPHSEDKGNPVHRWVNKRLDAVTTRYKRFLEGNVHRPLFFGALMLVALGVSFVLVKVVPSELAPPEDRGNFQVSLTGPEGAGYDYTVQQVQQAEKIIAPEIGHGPIERANARVPGGFGASEEMHTARFSVFLKDWDKRTEETGDVAQALKKKLDKMPGMKPMRIGNCDLERSVPPSMCFRFECGHLTKHRETCASMLKICNWSPPADAVCSGLDRGGLRTLAIALPHLCHQDSRSPMQCDTRQVRVR